MITVRQLERLWQTRGHRRMVSDLLTLRPEFSLHLETQLQSPASAAALAVLRLDELDQSYVPLSRKLICEILSAQQKDGGWGDALTTAICIRALFVGHGHGPAVDKALTYLSNLQKTEGAWSSTPMRRLPADAFTTAYILLTLGDATAFSQSVRVGDAVEWMHQHHPEFDATTSKLWTLAQRRINSARTLAYRAPMQWS